MTGGVISTHLSSNAVNMRDELCVGYDKLLFAERYADRRTKVGITISTLQD